MTRTLLPIVVFLLAVLLALPTCPGCGRRTWRRTLRSWTCTTCLAEWEPWARRWRLWGGQWRTGR